MRNGHEVEAAGSREGREWTTGGDIPETGRGPQARAVAFRDGEGGDHGEVVPGRGNEGTGFRRRAGKRRRYGVSACIVTPGGMSVRAESRLECRIMEDLLTVFPVRNAAEVRRIESCVREMAYRIRARERGLPLRADP